MTTTSEHAPASTPSGASWQTWIGRGVLAALVLLAAVALWPMVKGTYYGMVPQEPVSPDQLPAWRESYEAALAESAESGKPVLIDFTASWCPPCRVMEAEVWPDEGVRSAIADRVIPLKLDVDEPTSSAAAQRYAVQYIPTILLVDATGTELARSGFMSADEITDFIQDNAPASPATDMASVE